jgi:broad specificity phosphatase PhoE
MDLLLVCRAESIAATQELLEGRRGWPLSGAGRQQALRLGQRLAQDYGVDTLYTSSLQAAQETALLIGEVLGLAPPQEIPNLKAQDSGELAGQPLAEVRQSAPELLPPPRDIFSPFPGGESYVQMHLRVVNAINRLVEETEAETIAIVTHPGPIQAFLLAFLRFSIGQRTELDLACDTASLHHLRRAADGRKQIVRLNDTAHLVGLGNGGE